MRLQSSDPDIATIGSRIESGDINLQPDFQREIVWRNTDQTRFVDSLIKQLPIPSMCFSLDHKTQKWRVIDGLQRMYTIIRFLGEDDWILSKISDINQSIAGKKVSEIRAKHADLYRRVENITLPITVLRCDYNKENHNEYMFIIFHRLNAGGLRLNNQEIRNAIYQGPFNNFLKECNENPVWKKLVGVKRDIKDRFRKIELILRFFAFVDDSKTYKGKLASFLNAYMCEKRDRELEIQGKGKLFKDTVELIYDKISGKKALSESSNAVIETLMYGVATNIKTLEGENEKIVKGYYDKLLQSEPFKEENIRQAIYKRKKVSERLSMAKTIFSGK